MQSHTVHTLNVSDDLFLSMLLFTTQVFAVYTIFKCKLRFHKPNANLHCLLKAHLILFGNSFSHTLLVLQRQSPCWKAMLGSCVLRASETYQITCRGTPGSSIHSPWQQVDKTVTCLAGIFLKMSGCNTGPFESI